jgi:bifunctional DNA-binding transcriptional regulator/antitoxin component of YhaV-PrlF toxin-antitoxin module
LEVEIKTVDSQGRVMLPKKWRNRYLNGKKAVILSKGDVVEIRPFMKPDLTSFFDKVEIDLKSDLSDWHQVRKELRQVKP